MKQTIREEIQRLIMEDPGNLRPDGGRWFDGPIVNFAAADDPLFASYKEIIGPFHLTPGEALQRAYPAQKPKAATVICWILPIARSTRESNRQMDRWPSREWAETRTHGEAFNMLLRRQVVSLIEAAGGKAVAPQLLAEWRQMDDTPAGIASPWSERHAAYAAGLGTFSLNDALITERGIAHRCGSVVTDLKLEPEPRTAPDRTHNCLYHRDGSCGLCIRRCPVGAISTAGHDKNKCRDYVYLTVPDAVGKDYNVSATGCGLCQTRVPCEERIPPGKKK